MFRILKGSVLVVLLLFFSVGCDKELLYKQSNWGTHFNASYYLFDGTKNETIKAKAGQTVSITCASQSEKGNLLIALVDENKSKVLEFEPNTTETKEIKAEKSTSYTLFVKGVDAKGNFDITWNVK